MGKITEIRSSRAKRANIFIDGKPAFSLGIVNISTAKLAVGTDLDEGQINALIREDQTQTCLNAAVRFLTYRPRSESELKERLLRHGFFPAIIKATLSKLKEQKLVDDAAFARFWKENREAFSPRSRTLTTLELRQKGVDKEIIEQTVSSLDDDESAYQAGLKKSRTLTQDYETFRRRLSDFLRRRGYSYDTTSRTVARLWQELHQA